MRSKHTHPHIAIQASAAQSLAALLPELPLAKWAATDLMAPTLSTTTTPPTPADSTPLTSPRGSSIGSKTRGYLSLSTRYAAVTVSV
jgi:hypothetical protein